MNTEDRKLIEAIEASQTMAEAAARLGVAFSTFKRRALMLGVYSPNQSGKGVTKAKKKLEDVFSGKVHLVTSQLKARLLREGYKEAKCECCERTEWLGEPIPLELDHINGDILDNSLENLRTLCPNCHAKTPTYRKKNYIARVAE